MKKLPTYPSTWQFQSRKTLYDNAWIRLDEDKVINPGGGLSHYGRLHFKNIAIGIIPLDKDDNTWLVGQHRYTLDNYSWEIPMGGGPLDIHPLLSAKRELKEETGLTANSWEALMPLHTSNSITDERGIVYVARDLTQGETDFEETEDLKIIKLPLEEAVARVLQGEITDAISVAGLLRLSIEAEDKK